MCPKDLTRAFDLASNLFFQLVYFSLTKEMIEDGERPTVSGNTSRSWRSQVRDKVRANWTSFAALFIWFAASRNLKRTLSTSIREFGQSAVVVYLSSSAKRRGYLQRRWIG